eukprot:TRINITY_DN9734_c1_g1_i2.p1 TRINITY_DN9734_c1_g1~~TRINITY_DN9734_c1_g1_i2.p1  ORF type:complete len:177 (+),score=59.98 TRINITY_DN9734_c1_g1_i2:63-533(+)
MSDNETGEYEATESTGSLTFPMQCGNVKKGGHVCIRNRPCKVVEYTTSKTGKHGHAKAHIIAIDIFTSKKLEELCPTSHNIDVPFVKRAEYTVTDIDGDAVVLMDADGAQKEDLNLPDGDLGRDLAAKFEAGNEIVVTVVSAMNEEAIVSFKTTSG